MIAQTILGAELKPNGSTVSTTQYPVDDNPEGGQEHI